MYDIELAIEVGGGSFLFGCDYSYRPAISASADEPASDEEYIINNLVILVDIDKHNRNVPHDVMYLINDKHFKGALIEQIKDEE